MTLPKLFELSHRFVPEGTDPYSMFEYEECDVRISDYSTGKIAFEMNGVEVPKGWSETARKILASKYLRKAGVPKKVEPRQNVPAADGVPAWLKPSVASAGAGTGGEKSVKQVVHRLAGHWAYTGLTNGYFDHCDGGAEAAALRYYNEMVYQLLSQSGAPNSPQFFNTGLWWAYGLEGPAQGHWRVNAPANMGGREWSRDEVASLATLSQNSYENVQASACFILNVEDSLMGDSGILSWYEREARIFKFGSGAGANISKLRAEGESLAGGGKSSGIMSWMAVADKSAGAIKSGGTTRRAAKLICLDLDHPDIMKFINCKVDSELMVAAMHTGSKTITAHCRKIFDLAKKMRGTESHKVAMRQACWEARRAGVPEEYVRRAATMGSDTAFKEWPGHEMALGYEDEAYATVPYQNANNSVRMPSSFLAAVAADADWNTTWRTSGKVAHTYKARDLMSAIADASWYCADPGVQFDTIINEWNVTPQDARITASNPCSEFMRPDDSSCNLASNRLTAFFKNGKFDVEAYRSTVELWTLTLDITNTMAHFPDRKTAINAFLYRDIGLGFADLGSVLMSMGLKYDSPEACSAAGAISSIMQAQGHMTSATIAAHMGSYPRFEANRQDHLRCVHNHMYAAGTVQECRGLTVPPVKINWNHIESLPTQTEGGSLTSDYMDGMWNHAIEWGAAYGYRNAQTSVIAPTGTIGLLMDCDTTGVEPMLGLVVYKSLAGGGDMTIQPTAALVAGLRAKGVLEQDISDVVKVVVEHGMASYDYKPVSGITISLDLTTFDTSFPHPKSQRSIPWEGHVRMMGAVQSFVGGAISKTVNMPYSATSHDIEQAIIMSHSLGVKALAVYRDSCKLSQPLSVDSGASENSDGRESIIEDMQYTARHIRGMIEDLAGRGMVSPINSCVRVRMPGERRAGIDVAAKIGDGTLYVRTTRYPDGKLGEVWANYSGDQGVFQAMLGQLCKLINVAIQYGVPPEAILNTMADSKFYPQGLVHDHKLIKGCTSIPNLMARLIAWHEFGDSSGLTVKPDMQVSTEEEKVLIEACMEDGGMRLAQIREVGESCPECASYEYTWSGTCKRCKNCGYSGGCG